MGQSWHSQQTVVETDAVEAASAVAAAAAVAAADAVEAAAAALAAVDAGGQIPAAEAPTDPRGWDVAGGSARRRCVESPGAHAWRNDPPVSCTAVGPAVGPPAGDSAAAAAAVGDKGWAGPGPVTRNWLLCHRTEKKDKGSILFRLLRIGLSLHLRVMKCTESETVPGNY